MFSLRFVFPLFAPILLCSFVRFLFQSYVLEYSLPSLCVKVVVTYRKTLSRTRHSSTGVILILPSVSDKVEFFEMYLTFVLASFSVE